MVEDVAQPVPLGGGRQRHDHVVIAPAEAVREFGSTEFSVEAADQHGVHRVVALSPAVLGAVCVESLGEREGSAPTNSGGPLDALRVIESFMVPVVVGAPPSPVGAARCGFGDSGFGGGAVAGTVRVDDASCSGNGVGVGMGILTGLVGGQCDWLARALTSRLRDHGREGVGDPISDVGTDWGRSSIPICSAPPPAR